MYVFLHIKLLSGRKNTLSSDVSTCVFYELFYQLLKTLKQPGQKILAKKSNILLFLQ